MLILVAKQLTRVQLRQCAIIKSLIFCRSSSPNNNKAVRIRIGAGLIIYRLINFELTTNGNWKALVYHKFCEVITKPRKKW